MMTSSNGNIFRVTGPLCGEFTGPGEFPTQRPVTRSFDVFFDLRLNKRLSKQWWGWWFETPSWSLWRQCNVSHVTWDKRLMTFTIAWWSLSSTCVGPLATYAAFISRVYCAAITCAAMYRLAEKFYDLFFFQLAKVLGNIEHLYMKFYRCFIYPIIISHNNLIVGFNFASQHLNWPAVGSDWNGNMWTGAYRCTQISYIDKNLLAHFVFYHLRYIEYFITHRTV